MCYAYIVFHGSFIIFIFQLLFSLSFIWDICGFRFTALCLHMSHMLFMHLLGNTFLLLGWMSDTVTFALLNNGHFCGHVHMLELCSGMSLNCLEAVGHFCILLRNMLNWMSSMFIRGSFFPHDWDNTVHGTLIWSHTLWYFLLWWMETKTTRIRGSQSRSWVC